MKTMRKAAALLLLAALLCTLLAGCGNAKKTFKVSFVGVTSLTGGSKYIQGTCDKKTYKLSLSCFEGYTPVELSFDDPSNVKMTGTSNGGIRFADPVNLILKDGSRVERKWDTRRPPSKWSEERRARFEAQPKRMYSPKRRQQMSEHMKQLRKERGANWRKEKS